MFTSVKHASLLRQAPNKLSCQKINKDVRVFCLFDWRGFAKRVSICNFEFFNFHDWQVRNLEISKLSEQNQNFAVKF
jgi:hypothetical protein